MDVIRKVDSVLRPDVVNATRDRNHSQAKKEDQPPSTNPENTEKEETEEEQKSPSHLLDVRI
jgi:hypothetical protein